MIRYALACTKGHEFESWFRDSVSYDTQRSAGFVTCPVCGSGDVDKQIMAPSVARTDHERRGLPVPAQASPDAPVPMALMSERERAFRELVKALRKHVAENAEDVGPRFAEEARRMHEGLAEFRAIYGEATVEEAIALAEEGIEALPLPVLPDDHH